MTAQRTFASTKAALGYAVAVQRAAAGPASRRDSAPGPAPDGWLAASVFACIRRAGLDPHAPDCRVLQGVLSWATRSDDAAAAEDARVGSAIRRITDELEGAGIVVRPRTLEATGWRAVKLDGRVQIVSTTHLDDGDVYLDPSRLRADLAAGMVAPLEQRTVAPDPDARRRADIADVAARFSHAADQDVELAARWSCSPRTAQYHRLRLGAPVPHGRKPGKANP